MRRARRRTGIGDVVLSEVPGPTVSSIARAELAAPEGPGVAPGPRGLPTRQGYYWRPSPRDIIIPTATIVQIYPGGSTPVQALTFTGDIENDDVVAIGTRGLTVSAANIARGAIFFVGIGRSAFIWTDDLREFFDAGVYFAGSQSASTQILHVTEWTAVKTDTGANR